MKYRIPNSLQSGFTLTETSIAAAIVSFSLLPLVGLMGLISSGEKRVLDEAAALNFVETISNTLYRNKPSTTEFVWHFADSGQTPAVIGYPPGSAETEIYFVGDETGLILRSLTEAEYESGLAGAEINEAFLIKTTLCEALSGSSNSAAIPAGIEITISVETPVTIPKLNRRIYSFTSRSP